MFCIVGFLYRLLALSIIMEKPPKDSEALMVKISLTAIMTALVTAATFMVRIPSPIGGYFNFGDVMIFIVALTFKSVIGGFAGGVGSAISDFIGYPMFVVPTLVIKGLEGFFAGFITNKKSAFRDVLAVAVAGCEMILGYLFAEAYILQMGWETALLEVPGNIVQVAIGGLVGIPIAYVVRKRLPEILK